MKKTDFCGVSDAVDCIGDAVYAAIAATENDDVDLAVSSLNSAIKHAEYTLSRLIAIRDLSNDVDGTLLADGAQL